MNAAERALLTHAPDVFDRPKVPPPATTPGLPNGATIDRARAYLAAMGPAIEGQGGDVHTFKAACALVVDFALSDADAGQLLAEWNTSCLPPWDERDLDGKIRSARRSGRHAVGEKLDGPSPVPAVSAPPMVGVAAETNIPFRTAADLAREQPIAPAWLVLGFLAPGVVVEIVGKLKASGKTTLVAWMVWALVQGLDFLGRPTRKTSVLWLTEERPTSFLETLKRAGLTDRTDLHILHWHDVKHLTWPAVMRAATKHALMVGAEVLVVDTVSQFAGLRGDAENNSGDALAAVEPCQEAAAAGLAVAVLRHERKGGGEVGESGRGSSAFSGAVDIVVAIRRGEGQTKPTIRVLHTLSRFTETPDTLVIDLTEKGYVALGTEGTVAVLEAERALMDRLPTTEDGALGLDAILEGHEPRIARTVAQEALRKLAAVGVQRIGHGKRGSPYRYFRALEVSAGTQITGCGRNEPYPDEAREQ